jgi:predicted transcriptional regulator of viral defense system
MGHKEQLIALAKAQGLLRARDLERAGIPRVYLYRLCQQGLFQPRGNGLYALAEADFSEHIALAEVAKRVPQAVICLISALSFHRLTTQPPHQVWIAVAKGSWTPEIGYPPLNMTYVSDPAFHYGIEEYSIDLVNVRIYSPAKTVADCFKFRNKIGRDVAIAALKEIHRARLATVDEILAAATVCRVARIIEPYLVAIV